MNIFTLRLLSPLFFSSVLALSACRGIDNGNQDASSGTSGETSAPEKQAAPLSGKYKIKVTPLSDTVAPGLRFKADISVENLEPNIMPEFFGAGISVNMGGQSATTSMMAVGGFAPGQRDKQMKYSFKVRIPTADGRFDELPYEGSFTIHRPDILITPGADKPLYKNCGNQIYVKVPSLGEYYNPVFSATQAQIIPSPSDKGKITIVPTGNTCLVKTSSITSGQNIALDEVNFKVQYPPLPRLVLSVDGQDQDKQASISTKDKLLVKLVPDEAFSISLPKDSRYAIMAVNVYTQEAGVKKLVFKTSGNGKDAVKGIPVDLNSLTAKPAGTTLIIEVESPQRINFQGKRIEVNLPSRMLEVKLK